MDFLDESLHDINRTQYIQALSDLNKKKLKVLVSFLYYRHQHQSSFHQYLEIRKDVHWLAIGYPQSTRQRWSWMLLRSHLVYR